jgi:Arc/MetJ family transcription regulator
MPYKGASQEAIDMRTTLNLDEDLLETARRLTGLTEKTALVRLALEVLIERESSRRLALLGGSEPELDDVPRRQGGRA